MVWLVAFAIIAVAVVFLVGGSVLHPLLYGLFIAGILVVPLWLAGETGESLGKWLFGNRK